MSKIIKTSILPDLILFRTAGRNKTTARKDKIQTARKFRKCLFYRWRSNDEHHIKTWNKVWKPHTHYFSQTAAQTIANNGFFRNGVPNHNSKSSFFHSV